MKRLLILVVILVMSVSVYGQQKLTLNEAIKIALHNNYSIITQSNSLKTTEGKIATAFGNLMPSFDLSSTFAWSYNTSSSDYYGSYLSESVTTETRKYNIGASSSLTLFDGLSSWASYSQTKDNFSAAKLTLERAKEELVYNVSDYFLTIISSQEQVKVNEENLNYNKKMLEQIQEKNKLGSAALSDVYQWQSTVGSAEYTLINNKVTLEKAKITLLNYLSLDITKEYEFVDPIGETSVTSETLLGDKNALIDEALTLRKDYQSQLFTLSSTKSSKTTALSQYLPKLYLSGSFGTTALDPSNLFSQREWNAKLNLSWTFSVTDYFLFDRSLENAEVNILNAEEALRNTERTVKSDVVQAVLDYQAAVKAYESAETTLKYASESKKISVEKYTLGSGTILDVLSSDNTYLTAAQNKISQKFQLYKVKDRLKKALGKLDYTKYE